MNKQINKILNKINKLKKDILNCQIEKIGEITVENLSSLDLNNPQMITKLKIVENTYKQNMDIKNRQTLRLNEIKKKYNVNDKNTIIKEYKIKQNNLIENYNKEYGELQKKLRILEENRLRNMEINNKYKVEIDTLTNDMYVNNKMIIHLKDKIKTVNEDLDVIKKKCDTKLKDIDEKYKKKLDRYCCDKQEGGNNTTTEKIIKECNKSDNMKKVDKNQLLFLEKYYYYLQEFYELCKMYGVEGKGVIKSCISFTKEQINEKINEITETNSKFDKDSYNVDTDSFQKEYEMTMSTTKNIYMKEFNKLKKLINLELTNIKGIIEKYEKMKKLKTREENEAFVNRLKKENLEIEDAKNQLEEIYLNKCKKIKSFKGYCYKQMNESRVNKLTLLEEKKAKCKLCE